MLKMFTKQCCMPKLKLIVGLFISLIISVQLLANNTYYVSVSGSDNNTGTIALPFASLQKAISVVNTGDTIYVRGGIYSLSTTLSPITSGTANNYINLWAYPGETPVLDFSLEPYLSTSYGIDLTRDYWHLKGLIIQNAGDNGVYITGNYNIVENCQIIGNKDTGLQISNGGSYNYIHNCDAYGNNDPATNGQNADGIDVKLGGGPGNVIRGCRVYDNSDDGYDCYETSNRVVFDSCWAFHNGYNLWNIPGFTGNGNGFKLGGNFVPGPHLVTNCISFDNVVKGFDQNNNTAGVTLYNCTAFRNGTFDFHFPTPPSVGQDTLINNIAYQGVQGIYIEPNALEHNNSWDAGFSVSDNSFISLDTSFARIVRLSDGSIPTTTFLRLDSSSTLINAGVNVGIPFIGSAPDLGAFEFGAETFQTQLLPLAAATNLLKVMLNWGVTFEFDNSGWEIQRALVNNGNLSSWQDVGFTASQGNVATLRDYSFNDSVPQFATYDYRLKQTSLSGAITYSNVLTVTVSDTLSIVTASNPLVVFPNPLSTYGIVQFYIPQNERVSLIVFNSAGQRITTLYNNWFFYNGNTYNVPFNPSLWAAGIYYIRFITDAGVTLTARILKQ
jgi:hypothetical protein